MGKRVVLVLVLFLCISFTTAISTDLKESYSRQETMIIEFSGAILEPIEKTQVEFKRINVNVPVEYDVKKIGDKYYLWAIAPLNSNNYSLIVRDISTIESGVNKKVTYQKNFVVSNETIDYYIKPGFILTDRDFDIKVYSNLDNQFEIDLGYPVSRKSMIYPGENEIKFSISGETGNSIMEMTIGKYSVPTSIIVNSEVVEESNKSNLTLDEISFSFTPSRIRVKILEGESPLYSFSVTNTGKSNVSGIYLDYNRTLLKITPDQRVNLNINETIVYNISFSNEGNLNEIIYATYKNYSLPLYLEVNRTENVNEVEVIYEDKNGSAIKNLRCSEVPGSLCAANEICSSQNIQTLEGSCCTGICLREKESSGSSWIGYLIAAFIIVIGLGIWWWYQSKKKVVVNPVDKMIQNKPKFDVNNLPEFNKKIP